MRFAAFRWLFLVLGLILAFAGLRLLSFLYTDWLWFDHLGYRSVFRTIALTKFLSFVLFWIVSTLIAGSNLWIARAFGRRTREMPLEVIVGDSVPMVHDRSRWQNLVWGLVLGSLGVILGLIAIPIWAPVLRFLNSVDFGVAEPIFGREIGFYVFDLPLYNFIQGWLIASILVSSILVFVSYYQDRSIRNDRGSWFSTPYVRAHLSVLGAALALLLAWGYWLKEFELLYSFRKGTFFGAGYTDLHAQIFAYRLMLVLSILLAGLLLFNLRARGWRLPSIGGMGYLGALAIFSWLGPMLFEHFVVKPNEFTLEAPYIQHSIRHTRQAYGLDKVEEVPFPAESNLTLEAVQRNRATTQNIPLWDRRPLMDTYSQLQEIRSYYRFGSVDIDRYRIGDDYRQVLLAGREFSREQLAMRGGTWVNRHLVYTHGYGICMSPANEIGSEGLPKFYLQDIPPVSPVGLAVDRPEIYYGENMRDYVVVRSKTQEFDYPSGDENVYSRYGGTGGVVLNSFFLRIVFSLRMADPYLLVTDNLTPESRILFNRHIGRRFREDAPRRFQKLAPFLHFDEDPYLVLAEGRLVWIQDAYTMTNMYPYSEPYGRPYIRNMNYIRNSVKITMDAYDGSVKFYVWDSDDPLIRSYAKIFPDLFKPKEAMPEAIRSHVRYPVDLFKIQSELYNTYHMVSPQVFYNREDVWEPADEIYGVSERPQVMSPYYVIVKLSDSDREEFVLMLPATPARKANMIAWLFARCDSPNYGRLTVYKLPKEKMIYGPMLIERRIDQNTEVSREITLWSQRGSDVIRGNLLVIPIEDSFIYVEPLYLRATHGGMPELKRVLVVHGERLAMAETLDQALIKVFSSTESVPTPIAHDDGTLDLKGLAKEAMEHLEIAQQQLRVGNFAEYGVSIQKLKQTIQRLNERANLRGN